MRGALPGVAEAMRDPDAIRSLAEPLRSTYLAVFVDALHPVFLTAAALALMSFLMALAIKEVPLRASIAAEPVGDAFQMPRDATSLEELARIVERITAHENRWLVYQRAASRMGITLEPDELWLLARIGEAHGEITLARLQKGLNMTARQSGELLDRLVAARAVDPTPDRKYILSSKGREDYRRLVAQREDDLRKMLADWKPEEHPEVVDMMRQLAGSFASSPPSRPR